MLSSSNYGLLAIQASASPCSTTGCGTTTEILQYAAGWSNQADRPARGWLGAIRPSRPGGGGGAALAGFEVYPPYPLPYLPRGCGGKSGGRFPAGGV